LGDRLKITDQGEAILNADLKLNGRVTFADQDMAGYAKILRGDREVRVEFGRTYEEKPVVTVNASDTETRFAVKEINTTGFVIRMSADAMEDFDFTWTALAVKSPRTFESRSGTNKVASASGMLQLTTSASQSGSVAGASTSATPIILPTLVMP
jgi:hypothetical protein